MSARVSTRNVSELKLEGVASIVTLSPSDTVVPTSPAEADQPKARPDELGFWQAVAAVQHKVAAHDTT